MYGQKGGGVSKSSVSKNSQRDLRDRLAESDIRRKLRLARDTIRVQNIYTNKLNLIIERLNEAKRIDNNYIDGLVANREELLANKDEQVDVYRTQVANLHQVLEERSQTFHEDNACECKSTKVYKKQVKSLEKLAASSRSLIKYLHKELENRQGEKDERERPPSPPPPTRDQSPPEDGQLEETRENENTMSSL